MGEFDLFHFYRFLLAVLVSAYCAVRLLLFMWRCSGMLPGGTSGGVLMRRYVVLLLLRMRVHHFAADLALIAGLLVMLFLLIRWH